MYIYENEKTFSIKCLQVSEIKFDERLIYN